MWFKNILKGSLKSRVKALEKKRLAMLQKLIGYKVKSVSILKNALMHSSYANEFADKNISSNERLEFLGDSVLGVVITEYLYKEYPGSSEGKLSIIKSKLVSGSNLAVLAKKIKLGDYVFLGKGEERFGGRDRDSILACAFEALFAAVYIDGGMRAARRVILKIFEDDFKGIRRSEEHLDYKSRLQKVSQAGCGLIPVYRVCAETGPAHKKLFNVTVKIGDAVEVSAEGRSKKDAQQKAAEKALAELEKKELFNFDKKHES